MRKQVSVQVGAQDRKILEAFRKVAADNGTPITLSSAVRSIALNGILPPSSNPRRAVTRPRGCGKDFARNQYLKAHPEMVGTRRRHADNGQPALDASTEPALKEA